MYCLLQLFSLFQKTYSEYDTMIGCSGIISVFIEVKLTIMILDFVILILSCKLKIYPVYGVFLRKSRFLVSLIHSLVWSGPTIYILVVHMLSYQFILYQHVCKWDQLIRWSRIVCTVYNALWDFHQHTVDHQIAIESHYITWSIYGSVSLHTHTIHISSSNHVLHINK